MRWTVCLGAGSASQMPRSERSSNAQAAASGKSLAKCEKSLFLRHFGEHRKRILLYRVLLLLLLLLIMASQRCSTDEQLLGEEAYRVAPCFISALVLGACPLTAGCCYPIWAAF